MSGKIALNWWKTSNQAKMQSISYTATESRQGIWGGEDWFIYESSYLWQEYTSAPVCWFYGIVEHDID